MDWMDNIFAKQAPPLPPSGKKALVQYLPWINLLLGLLALYTVYGVWHWAHLTNGLLNYGNRLDFGVWLGLVIVAAEAVIYLAAFPATRQRQKSGWNLMFYALLLNIVYGVVILFTSYGNIGGLISTLVGSAVGFYLLFQIRGSYPKRPATRVR